MYYLRAVRREVIITILPRADTPGSITQQALHHPQPAHSQAGLSRAERINPPTRDWGALQGFGSRWEQGRVSPCPSRPCRGELRVTAARGSKITELQLQHFITKQVLCSCTFIYQWWSHSCFSDHILFTLDMQNSYSSGRKCMGRSINWFPGSAPPTKLPSFSISGLL